MDISTLLNFTIKHNASDLHLSSGLSPIFRIDGDLTSFDFPILEHKNITHMINSVMNDRQRMDFKTQLETDFSFQHSITARFRANVYSQERGSAAAFRAIPKNIPSMQSLNLPTAIAGLASLSQGLVLVTGSTGSGKTTTLAAIIDHINSTRRQHILTIEDPIEFIHHSKSCLINQREVSRDTHSFPVALRSALRQDPDVILIGELRDLETLRMAITAAETGHLVFATLHTNSASKAINRIIDAFPGDEQPLIRSMLSNSLQAVITQTLLKRCDTLSGRIAAFEIMVCTAAIRNLIREDKGAQMYSTMQTSKIAGMQTLDQHLEILVNNKNITRETALEIAVNKNAFLD